MPFSVIIRLFWNLCHGTIIFVLAILMFGYEKIVGYERKPKKVLKSEPVKETPVSIDRKNFIFEDEDTNESSFQIINADPVKPVQPDPVVEETRMMNLWLLEISSLENLALWWMWMMSQKKSR